VDRARLQDLIRQFTPAARNGARPHAE